MDNHDDTIAIYEPTGKAHYNTGVVGNSPNGATILEIHARYEPANHVRICWLRFQENKATLRGDVRAGYRINDGELTEFAAPTVDRKASLELDGGRVAFDFSSVPQWKIGVEATGSKPWIMTFDPWDFGEMQSGDWLTWGTSPGTSAS